MPIQLTSGFGHFRPEGRPQTWPAAAVEAYRNALLAQGMRVPGNLTASAETLRSGQRQAMAKRPRNQAVVDRSGYRLAAIEAGLIKPKAKKLENGLIAPQVRERTLRLAEMAARFDAEDARFNAADRNRQLSF